MAFPKTGLYVITRDAPDQRTKMLAETAAAIRGGATVVQYRAKHPVNAVGEAEALLALCRQASIPLIINDDVELALAVGADGVHLGRDDGSLLAARERLGPRSILGVSCYDDVDRALQAVSGGADYVAFGRFFPSLTKPNAPCAQLETLRTFRRLQPHVPVVAIGGITIENADTLVKAGADLLAVIEGVFSSHDPELAARQFRNLWAD